MRLSTHGTDTTGLASIAETANVCLRYGTPPERANSAGVPA